MIRRVILRNWKSHLESVLEFPKGVNIIVGINGSGKSSVFDAICFGLYGTTPDLQSKKIKLDDLIMRKPYQKDEAEVLIEFEAGGNILTVKRSIRMGKGSSAEIRENGKLIEAFSTQRVNEIIAEKIKTSYELFSKIIYSKQNSLDYFLNLSPSERKKKIDEILMIENFERARVSCNMLINRIEDKIIEKENFVRVFNYEKILKDRESKENEIKEIEIWLDGLKKELAEISAKRVIMEEEYSKYKKIKENLEKLKVEEVSISSKIEQLTKDLELLSSSYQSLDKSSLVKELEKIKRENKDLEKYLSDIKTNLEKKINEKAELISSINLGNKKIEEINKELEEIKKIEEEILQIEKISNYQELERREKSLIELRSSVVSLNNEIKNIQDSLEKLKSAESKCPVCDSKLTEEKKKVLIDKKNEEIEEKKKIINDTIEKIKVAEIEIEKIKNDLKKLESLKIKIGRKENLEKDLELYKNQIIIDNDNLKTVEKEIESIKKEIEEKEKVLKEYLEKRSELENLLNRIIEFENKKEMLENLRKKYENIKIEINSLESQMPLISLDQIEKDLRTLVSKEREIAIEIKNKEELISRLKKDLEEILRQISIFEKEKQEIERLRKIVVDLKIFRDALKITQERLREEFVEAVNSYMNVIWTNLYPYKDFISISLNIDEGDYVLQLQERSGKWINVEGIASGGERSLAALALRIAFSLTLAPQLKVLILDEPTHNLDAKAVEELARVLRESVSEFLDQVFIITHDERLEEAVTGKVYRFERDKEKDDFTKVVEI
ncbi:MAG: AAA family ATPase [Candidatus Aenigmatarchaeota archaeon]